MKKQRQKLSRIFLIGILIILLVLFLIRSTLPTQLDDLTPSTSCEDSIIQKADILYIIPNFQNESDISKNLEWCKEIKSFNKELALHGLTHEYHEFETKRSPEYFQESIDIFEDCFDIEPTSFKPPQLAWTKENNWIKEVINTDLRTNQIFHKVYHCEDTGLFPNWMVDLF